MYNNYNIYRYIENKQVQRIYHRLFGSKQKRKKKKEKEYSIYNKSSNNIKNKSSYLSAVNKKKRKGILYNYSIQYIENNYIERKETLYNKYYINIPIQKRI